MILRLIVFILVLLAPVGLIGSAVYSKVIKPKLKLKAQRQAAVLRAALTCYDCDITVDPDESESVYECGHWFHKKCFQKLLT